MKLIALVTIVAHVDGARVHFEPGSEVVGLNDVDIAALKQSGSLEDVHQTAKAAAKEAKAEAAVAQEFEAARASVQAVQAAVEAPLNENK
jgi:hypothetical protein